MSTLYEIAALVVVVWAALQAWTHWRKRHPSPADQPWPNALHEQLQRMGTYAWDHARGARGRKRQIISIAAVVLLLSAFGFPRLVYLFVIVVGLIAISLMQERPTTNANEEKSPQPPTPPPIPRDPKLMSYAAPRKRSGGVLKFLLIVGALGYGVYALGRMALDELKDYAPQARSVLEKGELQASLSFIKKRENLQAESKVIEVAAPEAAAATPSARKEPRASVSSKRIQVKSQPYATEAEVREAVLEGVAAELASSLARSGLGVTPNDWTPDREWTERHFLPSKEIKVETVADGPAGTSVYVAEANVAYPDANKIEQIWHEFTSDRSAERALVILQTYAGAIFMAGGLAVFLRLGTGRRLAPGELSWKQRLRGWRGRGVA